MKRTLLVGLVVLGLVGAAIPASSTTAQPTAESPVALTSALAQENATEYPPGVSEDGIDEPIELVTAHRETLENTSYTISTATTYRRPNGTMFAQSYTATRVAPGAESFSVATTQTMRNATRPLGIQHYDVEVWANETDALVARDFRDGNASYQRTSRASAPFEPNAQWELLYAALGSGNATLVGHAERNGTTLYKLVSTPSEESVTDELGYEFSALVDSEGVVHSFQMTQRSTIDDRPVIVSRSVHVTELGNTTVERPSWYEQAVENGTSLP